MIAIIIAGISLILNVFAFIYISKIKGAILIVAKDVDDLRENQTTIFKKLKRIM